MLTSAVSPPLCLVFTASSILRSCSDHPTTPLVSWETYLLLTTILGYEAVPSLLILLMHSGSTILFKSGPAECLGEFLFPMISLAGGGGATLISD